MKLLRLISINIVALVIVVSNADAQYIQLGPNTRDAFDNVTVAASATAESSAIKLYDSESGLFCLEGTISSASNDFAITFTAYPAVELDNGDYYLQIDESLEMNTIACTTTIFTYDFTLIPYCRYAVIVAENAAGKETATINADAQIGR